MQSEKLTLRRVRRTDDPEVLALVAASDRYLRAIYPPESIHAAPLRSLIEPDSAFFAGFLGSQAVACGGILLVRQDPAYAEVKRLFVAEGWRGRGFATKIMRRLEQHVRHHGIDVLRLETGTRQPEALRLYEKLAFSVRGTYGSYPDDPLSVFMEKRLV